MFFDIIASGSKGNATLVFAKNHLIMIDFGIPLKQVEEELSKYNKNIKDVDLLLVTHDHADHYRGLKCISPKKQCALEGTLPGSLNTILEVEVPIYLDDVKITPFRTNHDATNPCGYMIEEEDEKLVYMTDTGCYLSSNTPLIKNPTYLVIESNHDISMELKTNRPMELKQRILGERGHLCNEDSAFASLEIIGDNTKEIILAHLSEEANTEEKAIEAYRKVFKYAHKNIDEYKLRCARQYEPVIGGRYED